MWRKNRGAAGETGGGDVGTDRIALARLIIYAIAEAKRLGLVETRHRLELAHAVLHREAGLTAANPDPSATTREPNGFH